MLNLTKAELELTSDADMFFEKGARGRLSYISKRYSKVNNKKLEKPFDSKQGSEHITY